MQEFSVVLSLRLTRMLCSACAQAPTCPWLLQNVFCNSRPAWHQSASLKGLVLHLWLLYSCTHYTCTQFHFLTPIACWCSSPITCDFSADCELQEGTGCLMFLASLASDTVLQTEGKKSEKGKGRKEVLMCSGYSNSHIIALAFSEVLFQSYSSHVCVFSLCK